MSSSVCQLDTPYRRICERCRTVFDVFLLASLLAANYKPMHLINETLHQKCSTENFKNGDHNCSFCELVFVCYCVASCRIVVRSSACSILWRKQTVNGVDDF